YIIFVIQMKDVLYFTPNDDTHKAFGDALRIAHKKGVQVLAVNCYVSEDSIDICDYVEVRL
ncbi:MAG: DNA/RNA nuclease SfsA, partial [Clostridium butyricum]